MGKAIAFEEFGFILSAMRCNEVAQWLRLCATNAGGVGSIPSQDPKIPRATMEWPKKILIKQNKHNEKPAEGLKHERQVLICILNKSLAAAWRMDYRDQSRSQGSAGTETEVRTAPPLPAPPGRTCWGASIAHTHTHTHTHLLSGGFKNLEERPLGVYRWGLRVRENPSI